MDQIDTNEFEEPEGIDNPIEAGWGDYPLDAVFVRTEPRTVGYVVDRIERQRYILDPDFQRDFVWSVTKQSKLIESCIMRIPLPVFYVAEAPDGRIIVVDGLQRLTSFYRFMNNQFKLTGLGAGNPDATHSLEGKHFRDLSITLQERVAETPLTMYILDAKAPERARLDIFERVNSGEPLTRQQMRNALYNGPATNWLKDAASSANFRHATGASLNSRTMRDREAVNRFVAFKLLGSEAYRGDMDTFLAKGLSALASKTDDERTELRAQFDRVMVLNRALFGEHAFRKSLTYGLGYARSVINISLFEVCAVTMSGLAEQDEGERIYLRDAMIELLADPNFSNAITYSTNSTYSSPRTLPENGASSCSTEGPYRVNKEPPITAVAMEGFKCFDQLRLDLGHLTLVTGFNGGGKSTSLQPLLLIAQALRLGDGLEGLPLNGPLVRLGTAGDIVPVVSERPMLLEAQDEIGKISYRPKLQAGDRRLSLGAPINVSNQLELICALTKSYIHRRCSHRCRRCFSTSRARRSTRRGFRWSVCALLV